MLDLKKLNMIQYAVNPLAINCWGSTMALHGALEDGPRWVDPPEIERWLAESTRKLRDSEKPHKGDILVVRGSFGELIHTANYLGEGLFWHKPGGEPAEISTLEEVIAKYEPWGAKSHYYARVRKEENHGRVDHRAAA